MIVYVSVIVDFIEIKKEFEVIREDGNMALMLG